MEKCDSVATPSRKVGLAASHQIMLDVAVGLKTLHDAGVLHRDLHPKNILIVGGAASRH